MKRIATVVMAFIVAVSMGTVVFGQEAEATGISMDKAKSIAFGNAGTSAGGVRALEAEYDDEDGVFEIEFIKKKNRAEYSYDIAATDGKILKKSVDYKYKATKSKKRIGKKKAFKKVAKYSKISYSTVKKGKCKFKKKKRGSKYEIKFRKGSYIYEAEVLARNGKIIEWEYKYIGR